MSEDAVRIFPKSSAFETLLHKVYLDLWGLRDYPQAYFDAVIRFVDVDMPSMFQEKIHDKIKLFGSTYEEEKARMEANVRLLREGMSNANPFDKALITSQEIPRARAEFAEKLWHAAVDVLTEAGFNFPMAKAPGRTRGNT